MIYTLKHVWARPPPLTCTSTFPFLTVNQTLSKHNVIWQLTVTFWSDDSCRVWLKTMQCYSKQRCHNPIRYVRARTPFWACLNTYPPAVTKTLSKHDVSWQLHTIYSDDSCRVLLKTMYRDSKQIHLMLKQQR